MLRMAYVLYGLTQGGLTVLFPRAKNSFTVEPRSKKSFIALNLKKNKMKLNFRYV
jgi:hypothetical protein